MLYAIAMGQINSKYTNNKYGIIKNGSVELYIQVKRERKVVLCQELNPRNITGQVDIEVTRALTSYGNYGIPTRNRLPTRIGMKENRMVRVNSASR